MLSTLEPLLLLGMSDHSHQCGPKRMGQKSRGQTEVSGWNWLHANQND